MPRCEFCSEYKYLLTTDPQETTRLVRFVCHGHQGKLVKLLDIDRKSLRFNTTRSTVYEIEDNRDAMYNRVFPGGKLGYFRVILETLTPIETEWLVGDADTNRLARVVVAAQLLHDYLLGTCDKSEPIVVYVRQAVTLMILEEGQGGRTADFEPLTSILLSFVDFQPYHYVLDARLAAIKQTVREALASQSDTPEPVSTDVTVHHGTHTPDEWERQMRTLVTGRAFCAFLGYATVLAPERGILHGMVSSGTVLTPAGAHELVLRRMDEEPGPFLSKSVTSTQEDDEAETDRFQAMVEQMEQHRVRSDSPVVEEMYSDLSRIIGRIDRLSDELVAIRGELNSLILKR